MAHELLLRRLLCRLQRSVIRAKRIRSAHQTTARKVIAIVRRELRYNPGRDVSDSCG